MSLRPCSRTSSGRSNTRRTPTIRTVDVIARSAGKARLDPARIGDFTLTAANGQRVPISQIGKLELRMEDSILLRRDRVPTITVRGDIANGLQPPDVSTAIFQKLQPVIDTLPSGITSSWAALRSSGSPTASKDGAVTAEDPLEKIEGRWTLQILLCLNGGEHRFSDLRAAIPRVSANIMTDRLRALESTGLVERHRLPPP